MAGPVKGAFFARATPKSNEMFLYNQIGQDWFGEGITAASVAEEIREFSDTSLPLDVYVNSPGGSVFDGMAIYNQFMRYPGKKNFYIDGIAASIASVIVMSGDTITIAENGTMMIHQASGAVMGTADDMVKYAESLRMVDGQILDTYTARSGGDRAEIDKLVKAETWLTAKEALALGLVTAITASKTVDAKFAMLAQFKHVPDSLKKATGAKDDPRAALAAMDMATMRLAKG